MKVVYKNRSNIHSVMLEFEKGEKCFCCSQIFLKKTTISQSFSSDKAFEEYKSYLHEFNINLK